MAMIYIYPPLKPKSILLHKITQEVSMHSVSTDQCERVCFSGGHFADPVMSQLKNGIYRAPIGWLCPGTAAIATGLMV